MSNASRTLLGTAAAALMVFSLGCQPPKPPAPETAEPVAAETSTSNTTSNMTGNTTAASETPVGETP
ncbi:hypothetical protein [Stieleria mannarensis]|uniref:hypothetical protein n=1 Tax=Stieleria mannarensis TaxID=2755585 RepID=UPI0016033B21|nr:hypothetical protein [Rhodopirellula sp. JC639]